MEDLESVKMRLVSIVRLSSEPLSVEEIFSNYKCMYNSEVPLLKFGYSNLAVLLRDIHSIVWDSKSDANHYTYKNMSYPASPESINDDCLLDSLLVDLGSCRQNSMNSGTLSENSTVMAPFSSIVCTPETSADTVMDPSILSKRTQDIEKAKEKPIYAHYRAKFPNGGPLSTPNKKQNCSRRSWDQQVKIWKKRLYIACGSEQEQGGVPKHRQFDTAETLAKKRLDVLNSNRSEKANGAGRRPSRTISSSRNWTARDIVEA